MIISSQMLSYLLSQRLARRLNFQFFSHLLAIVQRPPRRNSFLSSRSLILLVVMTLIIILQLSVCTSRLHVDLVALEDLRPLFQSKLLVEIAKPEVLFQLEIADSSVEVDDSGNIKHLKHELVLDFYLFYIVLQGTSFQHLNAFLSMIFFQQGDCQVEIGLLLFHFLQHLRLDLSVGLGHQSNQGHKQFLIQRSLHDLFCICQHLLWIEVKLGKQFKRPGSFETVHAFESASEIAYYIPPESRTDVAFRTEPLADGEQLVICQQFRSLDDQSLKPLTQLVILEV